MKELLDSLVIAPAGEFDELEYAQDLSERIPQLYGSRGFIDFARTKR